MNYSWDITAWARLQAKTIKNLLVDFAFMKALLSPIVSVKGSFDDYRDQVNKRLAYNNQTIVFEALLNDLYDHTSRRIYIGTVGDVSAPEDYDWFYGESGATQSFDYFASETFTPIYIFFAIEYGRIVDFTVHVPTAVTIDDTQFKAKVNFYKVLSKRWSLIRF